MHDCRYATEREGERGRGGEEERGKGGEGERGEGERGRGGEGKGVIALLTEATPVQFHISYCSQHADCFSLVHFS